jgi:large subunit ribosomal protein L27Ae
VNVDKLWSLLSESAQAKYAKDTTKAPVIDITKLGFHKVLGRGRLPQIPVVVKAKFFSNIAQRRIRAAGGACVLSG